jgi:outer membrane protein assembly factor BamB
MSDPAPTLNYTSTPPAPDAADAVQPALRLWPPVVLLAVMWAAIFAIQYAAPATMMQFMVTFWSPVAVTLLVFAWWLSARRVARWRDRLLVLGVFVAALALAWPLSHDTVKGFGLTLYGLRAVLTVWVLWLLVTRTLNWPARRNGLIAVIALAWLSFTVVRIDGVTGAFAASFSLRNAQTAEERFMADRKNAAKPAGAHKATTTPATAPALTAADWPEFRGPRRDGVLPGVRLDPDWAAHPPKQLWRHRIGPGWSSVAVVGDRLFTQEQRGPEEAVVCYHADTGDELWAHGDNARFSETVAGPGPRATPTYANGKLYTLGAAGRLNCLDAATGEVLWFRDVAADSGAKLPIWGFSASPLVADGLVTVYTGGPNGKAVNAYAADTGQPAWNAGQGAVGYCSTQLATLAGVRQLLIATDEGLSAFDPKSGKPLWNHEWKLPNGMARITQPTVVSDTDVLLGTAFDMGTRRLNVTLDPAGAWNVKELYTTRAIKPYFNDLVYHDGYLYGVDTVFLTCVDAKDGKAKWRTRGYGSGQVLLLADQGMLLVLSETGEAALVDAVPGGYHERAKIEAIEGKTWNHPVIARGKLYVRNGEEIAAYALTPPTDAPK